MKGVPRKILEMTKYDDKNISLIYTNTILTCTCIVSSVDHRGRSQEVLVT